jgi:hypothetical protein
VGGVGGVSDLWGEGGGGEMTWWVWARDENEAVENLYQCVEYKTKEEAVRKKTLRQLDGQTLWKVEVTKDE